SSLAETLDSSGSLDAQRTDMIYTIEDVPPWYLCIFLGLQHYLTCFSGTIAVPFLLADAMCVGFDQWATSQLIGTIFFCVGITTLLQTTFGCRLPLFQASAFAFLAPARAILSLEKWKCNNTDITVTNGTTELLHTEHIWYPRIREIQGAIIMSSLIEVVIGLLGLPGALLRYIGPLTITPTVALIGLSGFQAAGERAGKHWGIAMLSDTDLTNLFAQYFEHVKYSRDVIKSVYNLCLESLHLLQVNCMVGQKHMDFNIFFSICITFVRLPPFPSYGLFVFFLVDGTVPHFMVIVAIAVTDGFKDDLMKRKSNEVKATKVILEGEGSHVTAEPSKTFVKALQPVHEVGLSADFFQCPFLFVLQVGSRRVIQYGAAFMLLLGMVGKFSALFASLPDPVLGALFCTLFGMITAVGLSNLQFIDLNSSRNLFVLGFSIFFGLVLPSYLKQNPLVTGMCFCSFTGSILLPCIHMQRSPEERGIRKWKKGVGKGSKSLDGMETYDLPFGMNCIKKYRCFSFLPISPTFVGYTWKGFRKSNNCRSSDEDSEAT
ncbi:Solute carrier family 23 member 2, partial [Nipponia nippon]